MDSNSGLECSYSTVPAQCWRASTHINRLLFKPVAARLGSAERLAEHEVHLAYKVAWQASRELRYVHTGVPHHLVQNVQMNTSNGMHLKLFDNPGSKIAHTALSLLQASAGWHNSSSLTLHTTLCEPQLPHNTSSAAVAGLFKVAARENVNQHYAHYCHDPVSARNALLHATKSDMFGQKLSGEWLTCRGTHLTLAP